MSMLSPGELNVGMFVTVYEVNYLDDKKKWNINNALPIMLLPVNDGGDYVMYEKLKGITLRLLSIQLPYLAVEVVNDPKNPIISIDTRKCLLMELNDDFVNKFTH